MLGRRRGAGRAARQRAERLLAEAAVAPPPFPSSRHLRLTAGALAIVTVSRLTLLRLQAKGQRTL